MFEEDFGNRNQWIIRLSVLCCAAMLIGWFMLVG
jgi:hypothetical protein